MPVASLLFSYRLPNWASCATPTLQTQPNANETRPNNRETSFPFPAGPASLQALSLRVSRERRALIYAKTIHNSLNSTRSSRFVNMLVAVVVMRSSTAACNLSISLHPKKPFGAENGKKVGHAHRRLDLVLVAWKIVKTGTEQLLVMEICSSCEVAPDIQLARPAFLLWFVRAN